MTGKEFTFYITLRKRNKGYELLYSIGSENERATVLKLNGRNCPKIFMNIVKILTLHSIATPVKISDYEQIYGIRDDVGSVVGGYLILIRRARNIDTWIKLFYDLLDYRYPNLAKVFVNFLELALSISSTIPKNPKNKNFAIPPQVLDPLSSALKNLIPRLIKIYRI